MSEQPIQTVDPTDSRVVMDEDPRLLARRYQWLLELMRDDQTGSLRRFVQDARRELRRSRGNLAVFRAWWAENWSQTEWFKARDALQREAEIQRADPATRNDYLRSIERIKSRIQRLATAYGIELSEDELNDLAEESRLNQWNETEIDDKLRPILESQIIEAEPGSLMGAAGDAETQLLSWARSNGLSLSRESIARYINNITLGRQSVEDAKQDIRRTYMAGMFPAWADRINEGDDPIGLFEPYRDAARRLLEIDEIDFDDPIMTRATQGLGADGKPARMPLYEFERQVRQDPRWQYTDNAYSTYTNVGTELLRMFGFR